MFTTANNELERATPESQGIASSAILKFVEAVDSQINELHSFMLLRHGKVIVEGWWSPYGREYPHMLFSLSKSFTSTAVGLAIAEGYFSIDDPVLSFFPDEQPAVVSDYLRSMRVRHLLTMSTGQPNETWIEMVDQPEGQWAKGILDVPVVHEPGTRFVYNSGASYLLSAIVQKTTGMKLVDFLKPRLFEPLGIENATWIESPQGISAGGIGLALKTEDVARFGQLYLNKGVWQGKQILPEAWIAEATGAQISNGNDREQDWTQGYGYQFWRCRHNAYRGDGVFGQFCIVMPEQDVVIAMTSAVDVFESQAPLNLIWDILLPAFGSEALAENEPAQIRLAEKLSTLAYAPVQGVTVSPVAQQVSGRMYEVDANELTIESISLNFTDSDCTINLTTAAGEETITCGYGRWHRGQTALFPQPLVTGRVPMAASSAWTDADTFTAIIRLYEGPFFHTLVFNFADDEIILEARVNVSLDSMKPLMLTAHSAYEMG